ATRNQGNKNGDNARRVVPVETSANALVVQDGICGYDWSFQDEDGPTNFALMAYTSQGSSSSSSSDIEVHTCSKNCLKSFEALQKQYDQQKEALNKSSLEIIVPPPYTGNFKPARADLSFNGLDDSVYKSKESDSEDENVFKPKEVKKTVKSSFKKIEFVKARNSTIKKPRNFSQNPSDNKRNRNRFEFTKRAFFVCGSFNHLIKDCDFHDKKMVQKPVLNNVKMGTGQREVRQVWNNEMRVNHQNFSNCRWDFAPTAVLTKSGIVPISAARRSSSRAAAPASTARPINTAVPKPFVNVARPRPNAFHNSHSPSRTTFNQQTSLKNRNLNDKVNTAKVNSVNTAKGNKVTSAVGEQGMNAVIHIWLYRIKDFLAVDNVLFTETECLVLSPDFKLLDESQVLLKTPRQNNMYSFDLKNVVPSRDLTCLFAKATIDESNLWHRRLGSYKHLRNNELTCERDLNLICRDEKEERKSRIDLSRKDRKSSVLRGGPEYLRKPVEEKKGCVQLRSGSRVTRKMRGRRKIATCREFRRSENLCGYPQLRKRRREETSEVSRETKDEFRKKREKNSEQEVGGRKERIEKSGEAGIPESRTKSSVVSDERREQNKSVPEAVRQRRQLKRRQAEMSAVPGPQYVLLPFLTFKSQNPKSSEDGLMITSFTTVDPGRARDQRNKFKSVFGQDKDANSTYKMFTHVSAAESSYENLGGSTPVNVATSSNADYPTNPLMPEFDEHSSLGLLRLGLYVTEYESVAMNKKFPVGFYGGTHLYSLGFTSTPMEPNKALIKDEEAEDVDVHLYRSMIRSLIYLKGQHNWAFGFLFPGSPFALEAFSDSDYAGASLDRKSTTGGVGVISESSVRSDLLFNDEDGGGDSVERAITTDVSLVAAQDSDNIIRTQTTTMPNVDIPQGMDTGGIPRHQETMRGALAQTRSERVLEKPNEPPLPEGHTSGSREGSMEHTFELMDTVPPTPHDSPLIGGYTPGSDEGRLKLKELMAICIKLSKQVLDLEKEKDAQAVEILKLKQRVESSDDDLDEEDASKQGRESDKTKSMFQDSDFDILNDDIEDVEGETVHTATTGVSVVSAPVITNGVAISTAEPRTPLTIAATAFIDEDLTIAQTLIKMKEEKAKEKRVAIEDVEDSPRPIRSITTLQPLPSIDLKDKGKGVLVEEEPEKPVKVKRRDQGLAQIESDAELAQRLHEEELAELDRAQKERQKQEEATSAALAEEFDEIQARIDVDHELAVRLTHEEQEKYTIEERARLLAEFFERRKKQLAVERVETIRNKPPTRTQVGNMMSTYLKHMGKYTHQQLKHKNFEEVQKLYEREKKWIDDFKPIDDDSQKADGSFKNYKIFSEMLDDFDRQDVIDLHRMLNRRLEVDYEIEMAFELLRFTRSQLQK
ncbi:hypothetical protein Tco_0051188, partial [Tanacetum coccineum]